MPLHAQGQRFQTLQEKPGVQGGDSRTDVTHQLHACLNNISQRSECIDEAQTMIGGIRLDQSGKTSVRPVEFAAIHDHAANGCTMPANKLGGRVNDDIGAMLQWLHQVWRWQCIIKYQRHTVFMRDIRCRLNIQRIQAWIAHCLSKNGFGALVKGGTEVLWIATIYETYVNPQFGKG